MHLSATNMPTETAARAAGKGQRFFWAHTSIGFAMAKALQVRDLDYEIERDQLLRAEPKRGRCNMLENTMTVITPSYMSRKHDFLMSRLAMISA